MRLRSAAWAMRRFGLLTDEEFAGFGPEARSAVAALLDLRAG